MSSLRVNRVRSVPRGLITLLCAGAALAPTTARAGTQSIARQWNEELLFGIRHDLARPVVHARNLFHFSVAVWDGWAVYDSVADRYLTQESHTAADIAAARNETISFAAYRLLRERFQNSPGASQSLPHFDARMLALGYDRTFTSTAGDSPAAVGNRIAANVIAFGLADGSNEQNNYAATNGYQPVNPPLIVALP